KDLRVGQLKPPVGVGRDGKDAGLEEVAPGVLQQTRVTLAPDDLVVDAARLFARAYLADQTPVAVPDGELDDGGRLGNGKEVCAFERGVGVVAEDLLDVRGGDLRGDLGVDLDRLDGQGARHRDGTRRDGAAPAG